MKKGFALPTIIIAILFPIIILAAWAPWVSVDFGSVDNKISQSLKKPCELFNPPISDAAGMTLPPQKTLFGVTSHYEYVKCGPGKFFIEQYFISFLGTVHKMSSKVFEFNQDQNSNKTAETTNPDLIGANWKTYTNKKYKYSFRYPTNIEVVSGVEGDKNLGNTASVGVQGTTPDLGNIFFINTYEAPSSTLAIIEKDYRKDINNTNFAYITIDGVKGIDFLYYGSQKRLEFVNSGILYDFTLDLPVKNNFNQILSTFQFLN
jgi:hypothetical protein